MIIITEYSLRNICNCITLILKSVSLNSYGIFQPKGPNFLLSWTSAWKKHKPYRSFLKTASCLQLSNHSMSEMGSLKYDLVIFALKPFGGSLVIFTPFCRTNTGKWSAGYEVNHKRKSGCVVSTVKFSQIYKNKLRNINIVWYFVLIYPFQGWHKALS